MFSHSCICLKVDSRYANSLGRSVPADWKPSVTGTLRRVGQPAGWSAGIASLAFESSIGSRQPIRMHIRLACYQNISAINQRQGERTCQQGLILADSQDQLSAGWIAIVWTHLYLTEFYSEWRCSCLLTDSMADYLAIILDSETWYGRKITQSWRHEEFFQNVLHFRKARAVRGDNDTVSRHTHSNIEQLWGHLWGVCEESWPTQSASAGTQLHSNLRPHRRYEQS